VEFFAEFGEEFRLEPMIEQALGLPWQVQPLSITHMDDQPSPDIILPSSQPSVPSLIPLAHFCQTEGLPVQAHPLSILHILLQPSPFILLPSLQPSAG